MWETIKNDPILKTVAIIILSVLGFGFAFNMMFGSNSKGMENSSEMGGGGYSLGNTLSYIFILAFKLLLIALVVIALAAIIKFAKKHLFDGGEIKMSEQIKKDPILKGAAVVVLSILAIGLIYFLFSGIFGLGGTYTMNGNGMMQGSYGYNMTGNGGYGLGISGFLAILVKILLFISVIGLIAGIGMYIKQNYLKEIAGKISSIAVGQKSAVKCSNCSSEISAEFRFCPSCGEKTVEECPSCGSELKAEWKCCPNCGSERGAAPQETSVESSIEVPSEVPNEDLTATQAEGVETAVIESVEKSSEREAHNKYNKGKRG